MKKICAWCQSELPFAGDDDSVAPGPVTHGICPDCLRNALSAKSASLKTFLDKFSVPVFLLDGAGRIAGANARASRLLAKEPDDMAGQLGGVAFECRYAALPGGCGQTIHCKTCTIRNAVLQTFETGRSCRRIPACPDLSHVTGEQCVRFLISTEKVGDGVFLLIDEVDVLSRPDLNRPAD